MQLPKIGLGQRLTSARQRAYISARLLVLDRFEMILERFAADRNALLDDQRCFGRAERVSLDRVRGVGQLQIVDMLKVTEPSACRRAPPVERRFLRLDMRDQLVHTLFLSQL